MEGSFIDVITVPDVRRDVPAPLYPTFPREEYEARVTRLQDAMDKLGCEILLLTTKENIRYVTGYTSWYLSSNFRPVICLVPNRGKPVLVLRILEKYNVEITSWIDRVICWGSPGRGVDNVVAHDLITACKMAITDIHSDSAVIGLEAGDGSRFGAHLSFLHDLSQAMPKTKYVDGSTAIWQARMIKSPFEIERIKKASEAVEGAIDYAFSRVRPGIRENEIARAIAEYMASKGVDKISYLTVVTGQDRYATFNAYATDREVKKGDLILVDISGHYEGYASDLTRVAKVGKATLEEKSLAEAAYSSVMKGIASARPGVPISEVNGVVEGDIIQSGYKDWLIHSSGHSIGLDVVEYPMIHSGESLPIQAGMVFAVEQGVYPYRKEIGVSSIYTSFRYEDVIVVTDDEPIHLSGPSSPLVELCMD